MKQTLTIFVCLIAISCNEEEHHLLDKYPVIMTQAANNIDDSGVTVIGAVQQIGVESIIDHGFVWSMGELPTLNDSYHSLGELDSKKTFQARIISDLKPDKTYSVRAYAKTKNFVAYGEVVKFKSLGSSAPVIERIEPTTINCYSDQIVIYGKNFCSSKEDITVKIDKNNVYWGGIKSVSKDSIVVSVYDLDIGINRVTVSVFGKEATTSIKTVGLEFDKIESQQVIAGSSLTIRGKRLNNVRAVYYDGEAIAKIAKQTDSEILVDIPIIEEGPRVLRIIDTQYNHYYKSDHSFNLPINIISPWKLHNISFHMPSGVCYTYNNNIYIQDYDRIMEVDLIGNTLQQKTILPQTSNGDLPMLHFMIGNKIFFCFGVVDERFWSYDISTDSWKELPAFPFEYIPWYIAFAIGNKGYIITISNYDQYLWEYDHNTGAWTKLQEVKYLSGMAYYISAAVVGHKAYIATDDKIWEFDNQTYMIQEKKSGEINGQFSLAVNGNIYISSPNKLLEYNPGTNQIKEFPQLIYGKTNVFLWNNMIHTFAYSYIDMNLYYMDPFKF